MSKNKTYANLCWAVIIRIEDGDMRYSKLHRIGDRGRLRGGLTVALTANERLADRIVQILNEGLLV